MLSLLQFLLLLGLSRTFLFVFAKTQTGARFLVRFATVRIDFFAGVLFLAIFLLL